MLSKAIHGLFILVILLIGLSIYILGRGQTSPLFGMFFFSTDLYNSSLNSALTPLFISHPWMVDSLPDGLWMLALMYTLIVVWNYKINGENKIWIVLTYLTGNSFEVFQAYGITSGTYDINDMAFMIFGGILPLICSEIYIHKFKKQNHE